MSRWAGLLLGFHGEQTTSFPHPQPRAFLAQRCARSALQPAILTVAFSLRPSVELNSLPWLRRGFEGQFEGGMLAPVDLAAAWGFRGWRGFLEPFGDGSSGGLPGARASCPRTVPFAPWTGRPSRRPSRLTALLASTKSKGLVGSRSTAGCHRPLPIIILGRGNPDESDFNHAFDHGERRLGRCLGVAGLWLHPGLAGALRGGGGAG